MASNYLFVLFLVFCVLTFLIKTIGYPVKLANNKYFLPLSILLLLSLYFYLNDEVYFGIEHNSTENIIVATSDKKPVKLKYKAKQVVKGLDIESCSLFVENSDYLKDIIVVNDKRFEKNDEIKNFCNKENNVVSLTIL